MSKISKISPKRIRKIRGGKDPTLIVEKCMIRRGFDPGSCLQQRSADIAQWLVPIGEDEDLEITLEGLSRSAETTLYMGINVYSIPLIDAQRTLVAALQVADTLIGAKLSLVNYDVVLSTTVYAEELGVEEVDYYFELLMHQKTSVQEGIAQELASE